MLESGSIFQSPLSFIEECNSPHRPTTTIPNLQREADEAKPALTHNLLQIIQPLNMRDASLPTSIMRLEIQLALRRGTDRLHPKNLTPLIRQPVHALQRQTGEVVLPSGIVEGNAFVERHVQEDCVAFSYLLPRGGECGFHFAHADAGFQLDVREVETDGWGVEVREWHLGDGEGAGRGVEVLGCLGCSGEW